jgi:SAM-dependent methyltransferase
VDVSPPPSAVYRRFARYYDLIYHGLVDYEGDVDFLEKAFRRFHVVPKTILDIGCGTGNHDLPLARRGYQVTGIDQSREMLSLARKKAAASRLRLRFVRADMRSFRLGRTFDVALCMFGAFGYMLTERHALQALRNIRTHLRPKGFFVFEFWHTPAARPAPYQSWTHIVTPGIEIVRLDVSRFDPRTGRLPIEFRFFVLKGGRVLDRFDELHTIQTHTVPGMRALLRRGGFDLVRAFGATSMKKEFRPVTQKTFRVMAVARAR